MTRKPATQLPAPGEGKSENLMRSMLAIAIPVSIQSMLNIAVNLLDNVMLGTLGEVQISAAAQANQVFFVLSLLMYGIVGGSNVMVAQFWGTKDTESINKVLAYTFRIAIIAALLVTIPALIIPRQILSLFSNDPAVVEAGASYLPIVAVTFLLSSLTTITTGTLRSVRNVRISVILSVISLGINGLGNWILIFGKFGAPALGIVGAAIATSIARFVEFVLLVLYMRFKESDLKIRIKKLLKVDRTLAKRYFQFTVPVILNELFWSVGSAALAVIMGRIGTEYVAANSIFGTTSQIAGILGQGTSSAAAVLIGNTIGEGNMDKLQILKKRLQQIGLVTGVISAVIIVILRPIMLSFYNVSETTLYYTNQIMWTGAVVQIFRTAQSMNMMGILRGGGDAKFVLVNDIIFLWTLAIPFGFLAGLVWKLPVPIIYCILNIEQFIKLFTSAARLRGNKWVKNVTVEEKKEAAGGGAG